MLADLDADDAMVVTRFGIAAGDGEHRRLDLVYPVAALKPHTLSLTGKVPTQSAEPQPEWRTGLTRAELKVTFPVRSVLAADWKRGVEGKNVYVRLNLRVRRSNRTHTNKNRICNT